MQHRGYVSSEYIMKFKFKLCAYTRLNLSMTILIIFFCRLICDKVRIAMHKTECRLVMLQTVSCSLMEYLYWLTGIGKDVAVKHDLSISLTAHISTLLITDVEMIRIITLSFSISLST